jgi:RNA polymerase-associated protein
MTTLYSSATCVDCHRVRFVLAEKGINVEIIEIDGNPSAIADLAELNPYHETPTLVDRDLVLYGAGIICEYLDERYPHPPLMPVDPVSRARLRLVRYRVMRDWYVMVNKILAASGKAADAPRKQLRESLTASSELFEINEFLLSDDLTLVDCTLGPLLWRLPVYGVTLGKEAAAIREYAERLFARESFVASMTEAEMELVDAT